jgi:hypothetical protein
MPTINQAIASNQALQDSGVAAPVSPSVPAAVAPAAPPTNTTLPTRGSFPPDIVLDVDFKTALPFDTMWPFRARTLSTREMVANRPAAISPAVATAAAEQDLAAAHFFFAGPVTGSPSRPTFRRIALSDLPPGLGGGGDGLGHGDAIFIVDSAVNMLRDEFILPSRASTNPTGTIVGDLGWFTGNFAGGVGTVATSWASGSNSAGGRPPALGGSFVASGATANAGSTYTLLSFTGSGGNLGAWPLLDTAGWKAVWVFRLHRAALPTTTNAFTIAKKSVYVGLGNSQSTFAGPRLPCFVGLRYDTDTTAPSIADATFKFEAVFNRQAAGARDNTQGTVVGTGVTPAENVEYRFEMLSTVPGTVQFTLTGGGVTFSSTMTLVKPTMFAATQTFNVDVGNGLTGVSASFTTNNNWFGAGSQLTLSATGGTGSAVGGPMYSFSIGKWFFTTAGVTGTLTGASVTGFPGLVPFFCSGNDTQATPATMVFVVDFFGFAWADSLASAPLGFDLTRARYLNVFGS